MRRVGFLLKVRPDMLDEYKAHHQAVWADMLEALRRTGWHNYSLFLREDGLLFGYFETDDLDRTVAILAKDPVNARWGKSMAPIMKIEIDERRGFPFLLPQQFHMD